MRHDPDERAWRQKRKFTRALAMHKTACRINASASHIAGFDVLGFVGCCFEAAVTSADLGYIGLQIVPSRDAGHIRVCATG